jgi:hypothetical protein
LVARLLSDVLRGMRRPLSLAIAIACAVSLCGCWGGSSDPRVRPVKMGDVDTGANSVESVRRQLQGTWELVALEMTSPSGPVNVPAKGQLKYDEYGNMSLSGRVTDATNVDPGILTISGRAVIDPTKHMVRFTNVTGDTTAAEQALDSNIDPAKVRYYEFVGEMLKTTVKDASGATTATATWKRIS